MVLKRFHLQHLDSNGKIINSDENIIIFFEKDMTENQKVVKITNGQKIGIEILNNKENHGISSRFC